MKSLTSIAYKIVTAFMIVMLALTAMPVSPAYAANTTLQNPTSNAADSGNGFEVNPTYAYADGAPGNAANMNGDGNSHRYWGYDFSAVPGTATIDGIEVRLDWWVEDTGGTNIMSVQLSWDGGTSWTAPINATNESTNPANTITLGSPTNNWGHTWTAAQLSSANFRVRLTSDCSGSFNCGNRDFFLDWVGVNVHYTNNLPPTTTALASSLNPSNAGDSVTFTATVSPATATGTVNFRDGATIIGAGTLAGGIATFATSGLAIGLHNITAVYAGDAGNAGSTSPVLVQAVNGPPTIISAASTTFTVLTAGTFSVIASGNPAPTFSTAGPLPAGVSLSAVGVLAGTPASGTSGGIGVPFLDYPFVITASNGINPDATQNFTLRVQKRDQNINFNVQNSAEYGQSFTINPTASSGLPVTVGVTDNIPATTPPSGCTLAGNLVTITSGTVNCVLTATQAGNEDYNAAPSEDETINTDRANTNVSFTASSNPSVFGETVLFTVIVTSAGGTPTGTITLRDGGTTLGTGTLVNGVVVISVNTLTIHTFLGVPIPYNIDVSYSGDDNFDNDQEDISHTVNKASTQVVVTSDVNPSAVGQGVTFTANVTVHAPGSGTPTGSVTFFDGVTNLGTATLSGGVATLLPPITTLAFGPHNITAVYNGDTHFATSTSVIYVQNVSRVTTTTLTSNNNPSTYGENITFTANVTSATPGTITGTVRFYDGATLLGTSPLAGGTAAFTTNALIVGTHPITAVYSGDATFATSTSAVLDQVVDPATLTVRAVNQTIVYGDADPSPFTFTYGGFVLGQTAAVINTPPTCDVLVAHVDVGTYPITCSGAVDDNYIFNYAPPPGPAVGTLTVTQKPLTITATDQGKVVGVLLTFPDPSTDFTTTGLIFSDTVTGVTLFSTGAPAAANAGTYDIEPSNALGTGLGNYAITYANGTLTVGTTILTITANDQTKTYGDVFTFAGVQYSVVGLLSGHSVTGVTLSSTGAPAAADVGTYDIVPSAAVGVGLTNYSIIYVNGTMTVTPRNLTFIPNDQTKVYGSVFSAYTGAFNPVNGIQNGDNITPVYSSAGAVATAPVGGYPITVTLNDPDGKLSNYNVPVNLPTATLTVTPKPLTVTATNQIKAYGTLFTFLGTEFTTLGLTNGDTVDTVTLTSAGAPATAAVAGSPYPIVPSAAVGTGLGNYAIGYVNGTMTITKPDLIFTSDGYSKVYGDVFNAFTGTIVGIQNGDAITAAYTSLGSPANAVIGLYDITITESAPAGVLANYNIIKNVGKLSVTRRDLTVVAEDKTKIYGDTVLLTGIINGVQLGDNITFTYSSPGTVPTAPVSGSPYSIAITMSDPLSRIGNYNLSLTPATLTVTLRDLIVTPDDKSKQYGTWFLAFTGSINGIQNGDNITANYASAGSPPSAPVATYPITATLNDPTGKLGNYNVILNEGSLVVSSSVLTITANNQTIIYGAPDPAFTFTYFGFASGDTPAVINTPPTCTVAGPHTAVGTYPIVCSGGADDAYTFTYVPATLTINRRDLVVTSVDKVKTYGALFTAFTGSVTGAQFGEIITAAYDSLGAPVTAGVGSYPINITLTPPAATLTNYNVIPTIGTLTVDPRDLTVTPADKTKVYGDTFTLFTGTITGIQNGEAITATYASPGAVATATVAGSPYPITAILNAPAGVLANYTVTTNTGNLDVTLRTLVVTPDNKAKVFGTVFNAFTGTISGLQAGDVITANYASAGSGAAALVGSYPITATLVDPGGRLPNYAVTLNTGTLNVALSVLNVTAENKIITYGDPDPAFTFTYTGFIPPDTAAVVDTQPSCQVSVPHNNVGTFPIVCAGGVDNNYAFSYIPGTLTVTSRALTVTPDNKTKLYGDLFTTFTGTIAGIQGSDIITANYASTGAPAAATVAGSPYPITATLNDPGNRLANYTVTLNTGTLTVTQRPLTVTPNNASKIYGNVFNTFTGTIVGIQNGDAITATYASAGSVATATVAGSPYTITATLNAPAGILANYNVTNNTGMLTVTQRDLVIQPADKTKTFGTVFSAFTGSIVGIQNGDAITATYASTGAPAAAAVGTYPITAVANAPAGVLANYNVSIGGATLTVSLSTQTITITTPAPNNGANGSSFTVAATASSGLAVTYSATGSCTNVGPTFTITLPNGNCIVHYNQAGNANFSAAPELTENVSALPNGQTITVVTSAPAVASPSSVFDVEATASSGLIVSITASGVCTIVDHGDGTATITIVAPNGSCVVHYNQAGNATFASAPQITESITIDSNAPTVTVNQEAVQTDPTNLSPINFTVVFNEAVTGFINTDVTIGGTAGATTAVVTGAGATYNVAVSGMTSDGTVTVSIPAGAATDIAGNNNLASSSTDNTVTYLDGNGPTVQVINTNPDTGDGALTESEKVTVNITHFKVKFNQDVFDAANSDSGVNDATNPNNYMLMRDLGDTAGFQTVSCSAGAVVPADTNIAIGTVIYDSATYTATFTVNGSLPLSNGAYRLYICGTTSIVDPLDVTLKLVGSNGPGSDYLRNFTVEISGGGGNQGGGGGGGSKKDKSNSAPSSALIPVTGFAPGQVTLLPIQPANEAYKALDEIRIEIPTLGINFPIVGVSLSGDKWNLTWLKDSVGYLEGSAYPTFNGNTVLTAHVIDANNNLGPFSDIKGMQLGDKIYIRAYGKIYIYEVQVNRKISPANISTVFKHQEYSWVTLVTCEDYDAKAGVYKYRRMVRAVLISVVPIE